jgi:hypothetical protein
MAGAMPKPLTSKTPTSPTRLAQVGSTALSAALQLETEIRTDPARRADRFVERWRELGQTSQRQYKVGDMSGYKATRAAMGDLAKSLERDPQLESILAHRKGDPLHPDRIRPPARAGICLQSRHRPRQRSGASDFRPSDCHTATTQ